MFQTISIHEGRLNIGKLQFQVCDESGKPSRITYYGPAMLQANEIRIILGRSTVYDLTVSAQPTPESVEYQSGYEKGRSQKRRRLPASYTQSWFFGWLAAWQEKD